MAAKSSFLSPWERADLEMEELNLPHVIDDEDFLLISDDVDEDASLGSINSTATQDHHKSFVFLSDTRHHLSTPPPYEGDDFYQQSLPQVSPDVSRTSKRMFSVVTEDIKVPDLDEIQIQYKRACNNFAGCIWQSELTRKRLARLRERLGEPKPVTCFAKAEDFLAGSRATLTEELEVSRRLVWSLIHSRSM